MLSPTPLTPQPERDTSHQPSGRQRVKPLDELPGPVRELVQLGRLSEVPFTVPPLSGAELLAEQACLRREVATGQRRLLQIDTELAAL